MTAACPSRIFTDPRLNVRRALLILIAFGVSQACTSAPTSNPSPAMNARVGLEQQSASLRALGVPDAAETMKTAAAKLGRASADESCRTLDRLIHSYLRPTDPSDRRLECQRFLARLRGFATISTAAYGTGGVIDALANRAAVGEREIALLLALDSDRHFKLFAIGPGQAGGTIGSFQPDAALFDSAAAGTIDAIRRGDCATLFTLSHPILAPGASDEATFCTQYQDGGFQEALRADPGVTPLRLGGNAFYGFYALTLGPGRYYTLLLGQRDGRPLFGSEIRANIL